LGMSYVCLSTRNEARKADMLLAAAMKIFDVVCVTVSLQDVQDKLYCSPMILMTAALGAKMKVGGLKLLGEEEKFTAWEPIIVQLRDFAHEWTYYSEQIIGLSQEEAAPAA